MPDPVLSEPSQAALDAVTPAPPRSPYPELTEPSAATVDALVTGRRIHEDFIVALTRAVARRDRAREVLATMPPWMNVPRQREAYQELRVAELELERLHGPARSDPVRAADGSVHFPGLRPDTSESATMPPPLVPQAVRRARPRRGIPAPLAAAPTLRAALDMALAETVGRLPPAPAPAPVTVEDEADTGAAPVAGDSADLQNLPDPVRARVAAAQATVVRRVRTHWRVVMTETREQALRGVFTISIVPPAPSRSLLHAICEEGGMRIEGLTWGDHHWVGLGGSPEAIVRICGLCHTLVTLLSATSTAVPSEPGLTIIPGAALADRPF